MWSIPAVLCTHQGSGLKSLVENILLMSYRIEHTFMGLSHQQIFLLRQLRLIAHALQILVTQRYSSARDRSLNSMLQIWESFLMRIKTFSNFINEENIHTDAFSAAVVSFPSFFESNITNPSEVMNYVHSIVLSYQVAQLQFTNSLHQASAVMNEPHGGSDNPLCFSAGLTLGINVEAVLENVGDASKVRVQVSMHLSLHCSLCFSAGLTLGVNVETVLENVGDASKVRVQVSLHLSLHCSLCFSAGLTLGINVETVLENVGDASKVRVQVSLHLSLHCS